MKSSVSQRPILKVGEGSKEFPFYSSNLETFLLVSKDSRGELGARGLCACQHRSKADQHLIKWQILAGDMQEEERGEWAAILGENWGRGRIHSLSCASVQVRGGGCRGRGSRTSLPTPLLAQGPPTWQLISWAVLWRLVGVGTLYIYICKSHILNTVHITHIYYSIICGITFILYIIICIYVYAIM